MNPLNLSISVALYDIKEDENIEYLDFVTDRVIKHFKLEELEINQFICIVINHVLNLTELTLSKLLELFLKAENASLYLDCTIHVDGKERQTKIKREDIKLAIESEIRDRIIMGRNK